MALQLRLGDALRQIGFSQKDTGGAEVQRTRNNDHEVPGAGPMVDSGCGLLAHVEDVVETLAKLPAFRFGPQDKQDAFVVGQAVCSHPIHAGFRKREALNLEYFDGR